MGSVLSNLVEGVVMKSLNMKTIFHDSPVKMFVFLTIKGRSRGVAVLTAVCRVVYCSYPISINRHGSLSLITVHTLRGYRLMGPCI